jgi:hypothetical protein
MSHATPDDMVSLCASHLREEESLLAEALPIVRAVQDQFTRTTPVDLNQLGAQHQRFTRLIEETQRRRQRLREEVACPLQVPPHEVRISQVLQFAPPSVKEELLSQVERVRRMADEVVAANHRIALHLRIFLDAYQRLLRDLTRTASGSGRYGPHGNAESQEYRPLIQIHG